MDRVFPRQSSCRLRQMDGSKKWQEMRARVGFDCHYTCPDRKEENATAERSCRVIEDKVKASLMAKNLPGSWWQVAARAVIWLLNRFPIISMRENMAIDGDEMRPLEFIAMGKYSRRQIDRELSHYVPFGMLCTRSPCRSSQFSHTSSTRMAKSRSANSRPS